MASKEIKQVIDDTINSYSDQLRAISLDVNIYAIKIYTIKELCK